MRVLALTVVALTVAVLGALSVTPPASAAPLHCSAGGDWDPVAESDVIVGGRITSWERRDDVGNVGTSLAAVELHMDVADVWKGEIRPGEAIIDRASLLDLPGQVGLEWAGSSGACGALDHDPTGMYAVFGLQRTDEGYLRTNRLMTFWLQPEPYDVAALSAPDRRIFRLPELGAGSATDANVMIPVGAAAMLIAGCTAIGVARRVGRS